MSDSKIAELIKRGDKAFNRCDLLELWQMFAEIFYPERSDFTRKNNLGRSFMSDLTTSSSVMIFRDLANIFSTMLRPRTQSWFRIGVKGGRNLSVGALHALQMMTEIQREVMYDTSSGFVRACKETDYDFTLTGNAVLSIEENQNLNGLLFRNWHLRDVSWYEGYNRIINEVHRRWSPTAYQLKERFGDKCHAEIGKLCDAGQGHKVIECRHVVIDTSVYHGEYLKNDYGKKFPFVSLYVDKVNTHIMEEVGVSVLGYVIPRWNKLSDSVYGYSPVTSAAFPDANLEQQIALTILEAGEKAVTPPMVAVGEALRSDVNLQSAGITYLDMDYDERTGEALRPINTDKTGLAFGLQMAERTRAQIGEAFYLNKLNLPTTNGGMSPFEISQRIQEFIRNATPLFEPIETDYNAVMCETAFSLLLNRGYFGRPQDLPKELLGQKIEFNFDNPILSANNEEKKQKFIEMQNIVASAAAIDPNIVHLVKNVDAARDVLLGLNIPASWLNDEETVAQAVQADREQAMLMQQAQVADQAGAAMKNIGEGAEAMRG